MLKVHVLWAAVDLHRLAKQREERLALVEYELRVAQEDKAELQVSSGSAKKFPNPFLTAAPLACIYMAAKCLQVSPTTRPASVGFQADLWLSQGR